MKKYRNLFSIVKLFSLFFFLEMATGWVRAFSFSCDVLVMFLKYSLLTYFLLKLKRPFSYVHQVVALVVLELLVVIAAKDLLGFPSFLMALFGQLTGYLFYQKAVSNLLRLGFVLLGLVCSAFYIYGNGFEYWASFLEHDHSFTGKVKPVDADTTFKMYNKDGDTLGFEQYRDKIVYLDFFNTGCPVCFKKFSELEQIYQRYRDRKDVLIQAVNIPMQGDTLGQSFAMVLERGKGQYHFPVLVGNTHMAQVFYVETYPTVIILKDDKVVFRGLSDLAPRALENFAGKP